ncbi:hypothetical protein [Williamsia muralis]|uniref:hypothetical protein n=1 Tax=Williamsia marianensis TaxID=85044 RepID=UPI000DE6EED3|nr:hypothetical protein [Williamsia marianensis]PVY31616.1 hypothetical protein C7458_103435 [Williamsia marianensis]
MSTISVCRAVGWNRVEAGYRIGLIGFKNELQIGSGHTRIVAIGDLSARSAIEPIKANVLPVSTCLPVAAASVVERHRRRLQCRSR